MKEQSLLKKTRASLITLIALSPLVLMFQNCGKGFEAIAPGTFADQSSVDPEDELPGNPANPNLIKNIDRIDSYGDHSCCGFYNFFKLDYPLAYIQISNELEINYELNLENGAIKETHKYFPDSARWGMPGTEITDFKLIRSNQPPTQFYLVQPNSTNVIGKYTIPDTQLSYSPQFMLANRYIVFSAYDANLVKFFQVFDKETKVFRQLNGSDLYPVKNQALYWDVNVLTDTATLVNIANNEVVRTVNFVGAQRATRYGRTVVVENDSNESKLLLLLDSPTAATRTVAWPNEFRVQAVDDSVEQKLILADLSSVDVFDPVLGTRQNIFTAPTALTYFSVSVVRNLVGVASYIHNAETGISSDHRIRVFSTMNNQTLIDMPTQSGTRVLNYTNDKIYLQTGIGGEIRSYTFAGNFIKSVIGNMINVEVAGNFLVGVYSRNQDWRIAVLDSANDTLLKQATDFGFMASHGKFDEANLSIYSPDGVDMKEEHFIGNPLLRDALMYKRNREESFNNGNLKYFLTCKYTTTYDCRVQRYDKAANQLTALPIAAGTFVNQFVVSENRQLLFYNCSAASQAPYKLCVHNIAANTTTEVVTPENGSGNLRMDREDISAAVFSSPTRHYVFNAATMSFVALPSNVVSVKRVNESTAIITYLNAADAYLVARYDIPTGLITDIQAGSMADAFYLSNNLAYIVFNPSNSVSGAIIYDLTANQVRGTVPGIYYMERYYSKFSNHIVFPDGKILNLQTRTISQLSLPANTKVYITVRSFTGRTYDSNFAETASSLYLYLQNSSNIFNTVNLYRVDKATLALTSVTNFNETQPNISIEDAVVTSDNSRLLLTARKTSNTYENELFILNTETTAIKKVTVPNIQKCGLATTLGLKGYAGCRANAFGAVELYEVNLQ